MNSNGESNRGVVYHKVAHDVGFFAEQVAHLAGCHLAVRKAEERLPAAAEPVEFAVGSLGHGFAFEEFRHHGLLLGTVMAEVYGTMPLGIDGYEDRTLQALARFELLDIILVTQIVVVIISHIEK